MNMENVELAVANRLAVWAQYPFHLLKPNERLALMNKAKELLASVLKVWGGFIPGVHDKDVDEEAAVEALFRAYSAMRGMNPDQLLEPQRAGLMALSVEMYGVIKRAAQAEAARQGVSSDGTVAEVAEEVAAPAEEAEAGKPVKKRRGRPPKNG